MNFTLYHIAGNERRDCFCQRTKHNWNIQTVSRYICLLSLHTAEILCAHRLCASCGVTKYLKTIRKAPYKASILVKKKRKKNSVFILIFRADPQSCKRMNARLRDENECRASRNASTIHQSRYVTRV